MNRLIIISLCLLFSETQLFSQNVNNSFFASANLGGIAVFTKGFEETYDSRYGIVYGGSIGLPISLKIHLYGKVLYFTKEGVPTFNKLQFIDNQPVYVKTKAGSANLNQWLINFGLMYSIQIHNDYSLGFGAGLNNNITSETRKDAEGFNKYSVEKESFWGLWGGVSIDRKIEKSPISIFFEAQYNKTLFDEFSLNINNEFITLNTGIRYHLVKK